jgi:sporulation protein YlmC with PRC-barrel domain
MKRTVVALALAGAVLSTGAIAQSQAPAGSTDRAPVTQQRTNGDVTIVRVDVARVALGHRASKLVGAAVVNNKDERIGTIDDLVVNTDDRVTYAVISVGGFLGMGSKLVAVPFHSLQTVKEERLMLPGATKEALKELPEFKYAKG